MKMLYFDFATEYYFKNSEIPEVKEFRVNDDIFEEFKKWLETKDFDYTTDSEKMLEDLKEVAEEEKYFKRIETEYTALLDQVKHNKARDLEEFQDEVKELLRGELVSRYYHQSGRIQAMLEEDVEVNKALEILDDPTDYNRILTETTESK